MKTGLPHLLASLILLSTLLLNQCAPTESPKSKNPGVSSVVPEHWVQVSSRPPTFYPRGVPADCPTDYRSGDWVSTGDAKGTRFFIPDSCPGRISRQALLEEALSARGPMKLQQNKAENREIRRKEMSSYALVPLLPLAAGLTQILWLLGSDSGTLQDQWKSSKKPHQE